MVSCEEGEELRRSRSQSVTSKRGENVKYAPWAFTEHGAIMAATVLNSPAAIRGGKLSDSSGHAGLGAHLGTAIAANLEALGYGG